nr:C-type lectin domain family 2 member B-like isoform X1 [Pogona vitticeps]
MTATAQEIINTDVDAEERLNTVKEETEASDKVTVKRQSLCWDRKNGASHFSFQPYGLILVSVIIIIFVIAIPIVWKVSCKNCDQLVTQVEPLALCGPVCPAGWIGYERKCFYFSEGEGNWTFGQNFCTSHSSTLAVIESELEKKFILRYKGTPDHWIGLWKESNQVWKWADETEFNNTIEVGGKGGECAFLSTDIAIGSRCHITRNWICNRYDTYTTKNSTRG